MTDAAVPAATVIILRDEPQLEVLMIKRHEGSAFAGGALVFPGGRVDPNDGNSRWRDHAEALDPAHGAYQVAAIREAFEESGILIARGPDESVVIEVKVGTRTSVADRLREVAERVSQQPGWRFSVVFSDPNNPGQIAEGETTPLPALEQRLEHGRQLIQLGQRDAAFLLLADANRFKIESRATCVCEGMSVTQGISCNFDRLENIIQQHHRDPVHDLVCVTRLARQTRFY